MNARRFDKLVRTFAATGSRRGFLAAVGGMAALRHHRASAAANQAPPSCGSTGDVCTMLLGCCAGLTCATSAINPSYGVCIPGEGEMTTAGTSLVLPFDSDDAAAAQTVTETTTTTTTTDPLAERQAEIEARKAEQKTRKTSRRTEQQSRKDIQQDRKQDNREERDERNGPDLLLEVFNPGAQESKAELLRVTNRDDVSAVITRIEPIGNPDAGTAFANPIPLGIGRSFLFRSGVSAPPSDQPGEFTWTSTAVCDGTDGAGFSIFAAFSATGDVTERRMLCDGSTGRPRRKRNKRRAKNQSTRGKGK